MSILVDTHNVCGIGYIFLYYQIDNTPGGWKSVNAST